MYIDWGGINDVTAVLSRILVYFHALIEKTKLLELRVAFPW